MDDTTRQWFSRQFKGIPEELSGHVPQIVFSKRRMGLTATCSCGAKLLKSSRCNWPGLDWSAMVAFEKYEAHKQEVGNRPAA